MKNTVIFLLILLLTATGSFAFAENSLQSIQIESTLARDIKVVKVADDNPVIEGISPTTGNAYTNDVYVPILVNIDNIGSARPQWGIAEADIVYEWIVQSLSGTYYTRLTCLYSDQYPVEAGPVRSARFVVADIREQWDALLIFYGAQETEGSNVLQRLKDYGALKKGLCFNGVNGGKTYSDLFYKVQHHEGEHRMSAYVQEMRSLVLKQGNEFTMHPFLFTDELPVSGVSAVNFSVDWMLDQTYQTYSYNADENVYYRSTSEGPYVDYNAPDEQLTYANIIVQRCELDFNGGKGVCPIQTIIGEGACDIFTGGRYIAGCWKRENAASRTVYYDDQGNELNLQRGRTWICLANELVTVNYEGYAE